MSQNCNHNCDSCGEACPSAHTANSLLEPQNTYSNIKKVIGVVSGKGGVGKSLVTALLALEAARRGKIAAVLDADITGPSIPHLFGVKEKASGTDAGIIPVLSGKGVKIMSVNLLLEDESAPVVWRGPVIAGTVKQFWSGVAWGDADYMFIDMPPGTGDVPLTVFQSIPIDGVIIVASPQSLVSMIVEKAARMADMMRIPILGLVENMSYISCPDCGKELHLYGKSGVERLARELGVPLLCRLPLDPDIAQACDAGEIERIDTTPVMAAMDRIASL